MVYGEIWHNHTAHKKSMLAKLSYEHHWPINVWLTLKVDNYTNALQMFGLDTVYESELYHSVLGLLSC